MATHSPPSELLVSVESAAIMLGIDTPAVELLLSTGFLSRGSEHYVTAQSVLDYADQRHTS